MGPTESMESTELPVWSDPKVQRVHKEQQAPLVPRVRLAHKDLRVYKVPPAVMD